MPACNQLAVHAGHCLDHRPQHPHHLLLPAPGSCATSLACLQQSVCGVVHDSWPLAASVVAKHTVQSHAVHQLPSPPSLLAGCNCGVLDSLLLQHWTRRMWSWRRPSCWSASTEYMEMSILARCRTPSPRCARLQSQPRSPSLAAHPPASLLGCWEQGPSCCYHLDQQVMPAYLSCLCS